MNVNGVTFTVKVIDAASVTVNKISKSITGLKTIAFNAVGSFKDMFSGLARHISLSMGIGTAGLTAMFAMMSKNAISLASDYEQAKIAFTGMLGSGEVAQNLLDTLQKFANVTPFEFPQLIDATRLLTAYGFKLNELIPTLTAVGDAVSGLGGGSERLQQIMLAVGQIKSKGFLSGEEARQMAAAGINAYQMVAEALGITIPQAMEMSEKRIINADMALSAIVTGMEQRFPGMMAMQSQTLQGVASTLRDVFNMGLRKLGEAVTGKVTAVSRGLINIISMVFSDANIAKFAAWIDKIFSRDNILKIVTWFANIYSWSKTTFSSMGEYGSKAVNWITKSIHTLHDYLAKNLIPILFKVTSIMVHLKSIELGVTVAATMAKIAGSIPDPKIAAGVLAASIPTGIAAAATVDVAGQLALTAAAVSFQNFRKKLKGLNIPEFPDFGSDANGTDSQSIINNFMSGFDASMKPLQTAAMETANNTGIMAGAMQSALSAIFGNGGDRMQALATRARFGNLANRGGGLQVNVTVATPQDAQNLRYALNYAAGMAR